MFFDNFPSWKELKDCPSEDTLLEVVTDELGNTVHIIVQTIYDKNGKVFDKSVMAVYPNGTLYPEYADKIVQAAIKSIVAKRKEENSNGKS